MLTLVEFWKLTLHSVENLIRDHIHYFSIYSTKLGKGNEENVNGEKYTSHPLLKLEAEKQFPFLTSSHCIVSSCLPSNQKLLSDPSFFGCKIVPISPAIVVNVYLCPTTSHACDKDDAGWPRVSIISTISR